MSITWVDHKSLHPRPGDCYFDQKENCTYIWQGASWIQFSVNPTPQPPFMPPTPAQMEKHPALKKAWEEFMVIKKLLGV